jgi:hypothetical protein
LPATVRARVRPPRPLAGPTTGAWDDFRVEIVHFRELDDGACFLVFQARGRALARRNAARLVSLHNIGRGRAKGLELGQFPSKGTNLLHVCGGKVVRLVIYFDCENVMVSD